MVDPGNTDGFSPMHPHPHSPQAPVPTHKKKQSLPPPIWVLIGATPAVIFGLCLGVAFAGDNTPEPETITVTVDPNEAREINLNDREGELDDREEALDAREEEITELETAIEEGTIPGDGVYVVGEDIQPGVYRAQGEGDDCYWARHSTLSGEDIITNHYGTANVTVEISESDAGFETTGCGEWRIQ